MGFSSIFGSGVLSGASSANSTLDDIVADPVIAVSVRKLRSDYSGACVRVRRSSDNAEQNIGFSGNDLDTASLESFCSGTDCFVTTWYGQQGGDEAGINVTESTASRQPKIVTSGTVETASGKPTLLFTAASNQRLVSASIGTTIGTTHTMYAVADRGAIRADDVIYTIDFTYPICKFPNGDALEYYMTGFTDNVNGFFFSEVTGSTSNSIYKVACNGTSGFTGTQNKTTTGTATFTDEASFVDDTNYSVLIGYWFDGASLDGTISEFILFPATSYHASTTTEDSINDYFGVY